MKKILVEATNYYIIEVDDDYFGNDDPTNSELENFEWWEHANNGDVLDVSVDMFFIPADVTDIHDDKVDLAKAVFEAERSVNLDNWMIGKLNEQGKDANNWKEVKRNDERRLANARAACGEDSEADEASMGGVREDDDSQPEDKT